jgi:hypothetical protein
MYSSLNIEFNVYQKNVQRVYCVDLLYIILTVSLENYKYLYGSHGSLQVLT